MREKIKIFTTTIIGGDFKGKKIEIPDISTTRSSKGILKRILFSIRFSLRLLTRTSLKSLPEAVQLGLEALSQRCSGMLLHGIQ